MKEMVEAIFTPTHAHPFEPLLNEPLAGTFNQTTANRKTHHLEFIVLDMIAVLVQIMVEFC